ncbi:MAG: hypothetical protein ONB46_09015 [candidate division KSB1 bacterium]|nr:hypothetical protein [candidate division KSB1 bacterium]MDZ7365835.1 hypothetical protein [candidate division KSB1 bacterium]MDZ7403930.1 hypothetical protein [candidate division KSB1 bacterium]
MPFAVLQIFEMSIPGKSHEQVGQDEQRDRLGDDGHIAPQIMMLLPDSPSFEFEHFILYLARFFAQKIILQFKDEIRVKAK